MEIRSNFATDRGRKRKINEDAFLADDRLGLYLVLDGMGGHKCGDVASSTAVEIIKASVEGAKKSGALKKNPGKTFTDAIEIANRGVWELQENMPGCRSMGATVAGIIAAGDSFIAAHAGDSRIYRIRDKKIEQMTVDHSLVEEEVSLGIITREEARTSSKKNIITRALGLGEKIMIDKKEEKAKPGDFILLCSDGLTNMAEDRDILDIISKEAPNNMNKALTGLIELANSAGGDDNITVVLVNFIK